MAQVEQRTAGGSEDTMQREQREAARKASSTSAQATREDSSDASDVSGMSDEEERYVPDSDGSSTGSSVGPCQRFGRGRKTEKEESSGSEESSSAEKSTRRPRSYKKQYCLYCQKPYVKIARHLQFVHKKEPEVAEAFGCKKNSNERKRILNLLRNRGNFVHNTLVAQSRTGTVVARKQPRTQRASDDFLHCMHCKGLFLRTCLWKHVRKCQHRPRGGQAAPGGKCRVQALAAFCNPVPFHVGRDIWKIACEMKHDEITRAVKADRSILLFGEHLQRKMSSYAGKKDYIRQKMRELGRLLLEVRRSAGPETLEALMAPRHFPQLVAAVRAVAGYREDTNSFRSPSLALNLGSSLSKICGLAEGGAGGAGGAEAARSFRRLYCSRWSQSVSAAALATLSQTRWTKPLPLPFVDDVKLLHAYLDMQHGMHKSALEAEPSADNFANLCKTTLTQIILFNRRGTGELSRMPLASFVSRDVSQAPSPTKLAAVCKHFRRIELRGKGRRRFQVLLTAHMESALNLLVEKRGACRIAEQNQHLFARPGALTPYRGMECLRQYAKECGAKHPDSLSCPKLRKQIATLSTVLNLEEKELDQLATFLGPNIQVHRQFYRLPEGTVQLAKISNMLLAMEEKTLPRYQGCSLDQIESQGVKTTQKKRKWEEGEVSAVERHLMTFIQTFTVPGKQDCLKCVQSEPALKCRDWTAVKFYVKNRISAMKKQLCLHC
ncbi:uncharacterized protein LOC114763505 [Denticeps clupeoides]|uniref:uncharacterized protein LOC114763505 n=1 Tax=Denticeps clupeoides TaxID=299321 RepID=UPI0010A34E57|nr:uncharacterized protein LOC114763505 [Denticeps clupeoides]